MDIVGLPLSYAIDKLAEKNYRYKIERTVPTRDYFKVDGEKCFVIRQQRLEDGSFLLTAAAKMRKEVY